MRVRRGLAAVFCAVMLLAGGRGSALIQQATPPLESIDTTPVGLRRLVLWDDLQAMRTFFERVDVNETVEGVAPPPPLRVSSIAITARRLASSWEAPFEFVRGQIRYVPYAGSVRGARGALESGAANGLDQTLLLQSLLAARGVHTRLIRGRLGYADASRLVGAPPQSAVDGDHWPLWVEAAASHWWLEADRDGEWVALDPSFSDAAVGAAIGVGGETVESVPAELVASLRVDVVHGDAEVIGTDRPSADLVSRRIVMWLEPLVTEALVTPESPLEPAPDRGRPPPPVPPAGQVAAPMAAPVPPEAARVETPVPPEALPSRGPWMLRLSIGGRVHDAGPFEEADLAGLTLRITVKSPFSPSRWLEVPWGDSPQGRIDVVVASGGVSDARLATAATPLYAALARLGGVEMLARESMRPPLAYAEASEALRDAVDDTWRTFENRAPSALGWAVLRGVERVSVAGGQGRVIRPGLRLVAVRWRPPDRLQRGHFAIALDDPIVVGRLSALADAASAQAAYGLLQSAVLSQILHRISVRPPLTAFDSTLRAVGTGMGLGWWTDFERLPPSWPATARAAASDGLIVGYAVVGPSALAPDDPVIGWWEVAPADGTTRGRVLTPDGAFDGRVSFGSGRDPVSLDDMLASLPSLHRGIRWLAGMAGTGRSGLATVSVSACAAAALAAGSMSATLPREWPRPAVILFCDGG